VRCVSCSTFGFIIAVALLGTAPFVSPATETSAAADAQRIAATALRIGVL
jgi:hypothetical protein